MSILSPIAVNIMSSWHIPRIIHIRNGFSNQAWITHIHDILFGQSGPNFGSLNVLIDKHKKSFWIKLIGFSVLIAPFFIGPKYSPDIDLSTGINGTDDTINGFCYVNKTLEGLEGGIDENIVSELSSYKYFIPLAYLIIGIGGMVLWPLSLAFIDTNAKEGFEYADL